MGNENKGEVLIYQSEDGLTHIDVKMEDETVWLTQQQMAELFQTSRTNVVEHIKHIYEENELNEISTCRNFRQVRREGSRNVNRNIPYYNLDMIISLGYRIKSSIATNFRRWATERLKEYMIKGFTMDDERLKQSGGGNYWKELLDRIRDIRSSEKMLYRQVLDLYATSVDYNPNSDESVRFFKIVQNKLHYAAHALIISHPLTENILFLIVLSKAMNSIYTFLRTNASLAIKSSKKMCTAITAAENPKVMPSNGKIPARMLGTSIFAKMVYRTKSRDSIEASDEMVPPAA